MANNIDKLAKALKKEIFASDERKPKPYDTQAEIVRVVNGTAWVHIPGGVEETPVKLTIDAKKGDVVNVHIAGGSAWITGNGTRPPTDDAVANHATTLAEVADDTANNALTSAQEAKNAAETAIQDAADAKEAAESAEADAASAATSASNAATSASNAAISASNAETDAASAATSAGDAASSASSASTAASNAATSASNAATAASTAAGDATRAANAADSAEADAERAETASQKALTSLANMEDVVGTLEWITAHGTMTLTSDVQIDPSHVYFVQDQNGDYVVGGQHYSIVSEPDVAYISTYYELSVDESIQNYVATHVAVDTEGLWIIPDSGGHRVLIATGAGSRYTQAGTYIIDKVNNVDVVLAKFGSTTRIGKETAGNGNVITEADGMSLRVGTTEMGSLKQLTNYFPPDFHTDYAYNNVLQLKAKEFFQLVSDSQTIMEAGTKYVIVPDYDSPDYDPDGPSEDQPTIVEHQGVHINFRTSDNDLFAIGGGGAIGSSDLVDFWKKVEEPTGNPKQEGWYERFYPYEGDDEYYIYQKTSDTTVQSGKKYYEQDTAFVGVGVTVTDIETTKESGYVSLSVNNYDRDGLTRGVYDGTLPYSEWIIGRNEDGTMKLFGKPLADFVVAQSEKRVTDIGTGTWSWREWNSGKVEIWYRGTVTLTTRSSASGLYRNMRRITFPNGYALYKCTCVASGTTGGSWVNCGGLFSSSGNEPYTMAEVMTYQINTYPANEQTNVNIYICGQKPIYE